NQIRSECTKHKQVVESEVGAGSPMQGGESGAEAGSTSKKPNQKRVQETQASSRIRGRCRKHKQVTKSEAAARSTSK
ncbi:hypothetical protein, partial [Paenibacillus solani]